MISAIATTSTVASRWRRKARPAVLRALLRGGVAPGGWLGRSVRFSTASLTFLIRSVRLLRYPGQRGWGPGRFCQAVSTVLHPLRGEPERQAGPSPRNAGRGPSVGGLGGHGLVVACAFWMAPAGRLMYFCAVVWPWNRLDTW